MQSFNIFVLLMLFLLVVNYSFKQSENRNRSSFAIVLQLFKICNFLLHFYSITVPKSIIEKNFSIPEAESIKITKSDLLKLGEE